MEIKREEELRRRDEDEERGIALHGYMGQHSSVFCVSRVQLAWQQVSRDFAMFVVEADADGWLHAMGLEGRNGPNVACYLACDSEDWCVQALMLRMGLEGSVVLRVGAECMKAWVLLFSGSYLP